MGFVMLGEPERRVLVHLSLLESNLLYFSINLFLVVKIVGESTRHLGGREMREIPKEVFSCQPTTVVNRDGANRKACTLDNGTPTANAPLPLDIRMRWHFLSS
jgi:hypothetical protein